MIKVLKSRNMAWGWEGACDRYGGEGNVYRAVVGKPEYRDH
jgi:hypothetical protein